MHQKETIKRILALKGGLTTQAANIIMEDILLWSEVLYLTEFLEEVSPLQRLWHIQHNIYEIPEGHVWHPGRNSYIDKKELRRHHHHDHDHHHGRPIITDDDKVEDEILEEVNDLEERLDTFIDKSTDLDEEILKEIRELAKEVSDIKKELDEEIHPAIQYRLIIKAGNVEQK